MIIPAQPGFFLLVIDDTNGDVIISGPIIAWKISGDKDVSPITDEEVVGEKHQEWAILRPNGEVCCPLSCVYDSLERFQSAVRGEKPRE